MRADESGAGNREGGEAISMLNYQIDKLRFSAQKLHNLANGQVNQGFPARTELLDAADAMRDAMDTIISLRNRLQELQGVGGESRYSELFGTPERAARTLAKACGECSEAFPCRECPLYPIVGNNVYEPEILEWLKGDA